MSRNRGRVSVLVCVGFVRSGLGPRKIASLAPAVVEAAAEDDEVRDAILKTAGRELALAASAVARTLAWNESTLPLAIAGGFILGCSLVVESLLESITDILKINIHPSCVPDPAAGAIVLASRALSAIVKMSFVHS